MNLRVEIPCLVVGKNDCTFICKLHKHIERKKGLSKGKFWTEWPIYHIFSVLILYFPHTDMFGVLNVLLSPCWSRSKNDFK